MLVGWATDIGLARDHNEDACYAGPDCIAVADGMGGHKAGEVASGIAIEVVEREHQASHPEAGFNVSECIEHANAAVFKASRSSDSLSGMGTTLTVAHFRDSRVHIGHVGDSRAYMIRGDSVAQLTQDHSVVGEMIRSGLLTEEQAESHPQRHAITRALGFSEHVECDTVEAELSADDSVLLCTDGLHDLVTADEIAAVVRRCHAKGPETACAELIAIARSRGGHDNITVAIAQVDEADMIHCAGGGD